MPELEEHTAQQRPRVVRSGQHTAEVQAIAVARVGASSVPWTPIQLDVLVAYFEVVQDEVHALLTACTRRSLMCRSTHLSQSQLHFDAQEVKHLLQNVHRTREHRGTGRHDVYGRTKQYH
jgi:hypothetical protein